MVRKVKTKKIKHRTFAGERERVDQKRKANLSGRRGIYWWVGGHLKDSKGRIKEALLRAKDENDAQQMAFNKFEPTPAPDVFYTTVGDTNEANRIYRMRMAERRDMLLGDTFARVRHRGKDIGID